MGRLVGLELHNFKSYRGTAKVGFGDSSFTSIIGPNGAGKSNMMDAISFVLGVQSSHLRSQSLKDLIYRGRLALNGNDTASKDPPTAHVVAVYEKDNGETMHLKRSITVTGTSEYKINDKAVTALQYSMALKAENILIKARNFLVFQGDIENIASQSARDLAASIETISGSSEYATEYNQLLEEQEKAHEMSAEVFSRKRNLNYESKQYKEQMKERVLFESKLNQKNTLWKTLHLFRIFHNEKRHFQLLGDVRRITSEIDTTKSNIKTQESEYKLLMSDYAEKDLEIKKIEASLSELQAATEASKRSLIPFQAKKKALLNKISSTERKIQDLLRDITNQKLQEKDQKKKLAEVEKLLADFEERVQNMHNKIKLTPDDIKEYEGLRLQFLANSGSQYEEQLSLLTADKEGLSSSLRNHASQKDYALSKISDLESEMSIKLSPRSHDVNAQLEELQEEKSSKIKAKEALLAKKEEVNYLELELNSELRATLIRLDELSSEQNESKKQKRLRDNVSMLRNLVKDGSIKGLMYELVRSTQQKYETALLTVLGRYYDAIVVESTATAHKCIEILKERRAGSATFIPLDSVVYDQVNLNYLRTLSENASPAIDIVKFDDKSIERAVRFAVGDSIVVDSLQLARDLKWNSLHVLENKLVALDGSVIHKSGLMTGGQLDQSKTRRWSKEEWNELNLKKEELVQKLARVNAEKPSAIDINILTEEISAINDELPLVKSKKASLDRQIDEKQQEISFHQNTISEHEAQIERLTNEVSELDQKIKNAQELIERLQQKVYSKFCSSHSMDSIADYELTHGSAIRIRARERAEFQKAISSFKNRLEFQIERINETQARILRLESELPAYQAELESLDQEMSQTKDQIDRQEAEYEISLEEKSKLESHVDERMRLANVKETDINDLQNSAKVLNKELVNCEEMVLRIDAERLNMLKNCKIENIDLPLEDGFLDSISLGEDLADVSKAAYLIHVDYSLLDYKWQEHYSVKKEAEIKANIENVEKELQLLAPNAKAMERLREVDQKLKEFDREFTKARQTEKKTMDRFNQIKQRRTELFMEAFNHISGKIDEIYKELTKSTASPTGGSAYLTLEDEDEPYAGGIKYHAMPPMKRFRDMDLLSGGEKTMAALALLFAIHSYQPSPFFVLDEIDAALDNNNVTKIANYIKKCAGPGFQFILISLKSKLFENSDALVGIYREQRENSSKTVSLDLRKYPEEVQDVDSHASQPAATTA